MLEEKGNAPVGEISSGTLPVKKAVEIIYPDTGASRCQECETFLP